MSTCPYCGRPDDRPAQTVSRHRTQSGLTVWTRCACGSLQLRVVTAASLTISVRGRPPGDNTAATARTATATATKATAKAKARARPSASGT